MTSSTPEEAERARRRRAAELLGDLLPTTTSDETELGWNEQSGGEQHDEASRDEQYRRDVPPHHG